MLEIHQLHASIEGKNILQGIDLCIPQGEVHVIMGPNGSGKSTLANLLAGRPDITVSSGAVSYNGKDLLELSTEERAHAGVFLALQYPVEIPGLSNGVFLRASMNALRKARGAPEIDAFDFLKQIKETLRTIGVDEAFLYRSLNEGFSGGEKKRNEILQMTLLEPTLAFLDEIDSGLDIDSLKRVAEGINRFRNVQRSIVLITHYLRVLDYVKPDRVHILNQGKVVCSGSIGLAQELERYGYDEVIKQHSPNHG
jgi:Fe-S cluster assembly ATP-binding protein